MNNEPITIISDAGVDDLIALLLLYRLSPYARHTVISSFGNVAETFTYKNIREFICFTAQHWSLSRGAKKPLKPFPGAWADTFHGKDGAWGVHPNVQTKRVPVRSSPDRNATVLSLGPITELLKLADTSSIQSLMIMGGAFNRKGNETAYAEYNIYCDPDAAARFFETCTDMETYVVPLDVTYQTQWTREQILQTNTKTNVHRWVKRLLLAWFSGWGTPQRSRFTLFDPLSVFLMFYPEYASWKTSGIRVETEGEEKGRTTFYNSHPLCKIAVDLKNPDKMQQKMLDIIFS